MTFFVEAKDASSVVHQAIQRILLDGTSYISGPLSMNAGNRIIECINSNIILLNPRRRVFVSDIVPPVFNPALAAARTLYLLSGSDRLEPISFYSNSVRRFSDDGQTLSGSSYGHRIFSGSHGRNQFSECAALIRNRVRTKRAAIAIYSDLDTGRMSKDIPCALSIVFVPRDKLDIVTIMRANDALRLLPYNIFEFTVLAECMAAQAGFELGRYHQFAVSIHLRSEGISLGQQIKGEEIVDLGEMLEIKTFSDDLRRNVTEAESRIRSRQLRTFDLEGWCCQYDEFWLDLLYVLAIEADRRDGVELERLETECENFLERHNRCLLMKSYRRFLTLTSSAASIALP